MSLSSERLKLIENELSSAPDVSAMTERPIERPAVRALHDAAEVMACLYADLDEAQARARSAENAAMLATKEIESLIAQLRRTRGERDHYMRAFTALSSQIEGLGSSFISAVEMARVHGTSEQQPKRQQRKEPQMPHDDVPGFIRKEPAMRGVPVR